jgi:hypothetical protein
VAGSSGHDPFASWGEAVMRLIRAVPTAVWLLAAGFAIGALIALS